MSHMCENGWSERMPVGNDMQISLSSENGFYTANVYDSDGAHIGISWDMTEKAMKELIGEIITEQAYVIQTDLINQIVSSQHYAEGVRNVQGVTFKGTPLEDYLKGERYLVDAHTGKLLSDEKQSAKKKKSDYDER